jgi:Domain of unknown function (DUF4262)
MPMLDDFKWPDVEGEADETIIRNVRKHGCHIVSIWDGNPQFAFAVGLFLNYGQAELVIFGLESADSASIINDVRDRAAAGRSYAAGDICDDILDDRQVAFAEVPLQAYVAYLGTAIWFYRKCRRPFPCLQIVWPDREGHFPWQTGYDAALKQYQPVLKSFS